MVTNKNMKVYQFCIFGKILIYTYFPSYVTVESWLSKIILGTVFPIQIFSVNKLHLKWPIGWV